MRLPQQLQSSRLHLRPLTPDDTPALLSSLFCDARVVEFLSTQLLSPEDHALAEAFVQYTLEQWLLPEGERIWALCHRDTQALLGTLTLTPDLASHSPNFELGYALAYAHWGHGYLQEALQVLCDEIFAIAPRARIWGWVHPENQRCHRLLLRLGFRSQPDTHTLRPFPLLSANRADGLHAITTWFLRADAFYARDL